MAGTKRPLRASRRITRAVPGRGVTQVVLGLLVYLLLERLVVISVSLAIYPEHTGPAGNSATVASGAWLAQLVESPADHLKHLHVRCNDERP